MKVEYSDSDAIRDFKFPKTERLHHRSLLEGLFRFGHTFYEYPFRITWRKMSHEDLIKNFRSQVPEEIGAVQMMVSVPKKKRKRAVDRVLMRRRIREAYRKKRIELKDIVTEDPDIATLSVGIVYIHNQNLEYSAVEVKIETVLQKLREKIGNRSR